MQNNVFEMIFLIFGFESYEAILNVLFRKRVYVFFKILSNQSLHINDINV